MLFLVHIKTKPDEKKVLILSFVLAAGFGARAQTSGWETGLTGSIGASGHFFTDVQPAGKPFTDYMKSTLHPGLSYSAGIYGRKFFNRTRQGKELSNGQFGLELAVQYTSLSVAGKKQTFTDQNGTPIGTGSYSLNQSYVEIPVRFVYKKQLGKAFSIGCFAGLAPAFLTQSRQRNVIRPAGEEKTTGILNNYDISNRFNLIADAGLLLRADISPHFALDFKPFFRTTALSTYKYKKEDIPFYKQYCMTGGLTVSSVWKF